MKNKSIEVLPGAEGIKEAYRRSLDAKAIDIVCLSEKYEEVLGGFFDQEYAPKLYSGAIRTREVLRATGDSRNTEKNTPSHDVRFIPVEGSCESDMLLTENSIILISFDINNPFAVVISEQEVVRSFRVQFDALWEGLK